MKEVITRAVIVGRLVTAGVVVGLLGSARTGAAPAEQEMQAESCRIVSQHQAVFNKLPVGLAPYSTDAILLGNGDIAMSISGTPPEKGAASRKQEAGKIRFWFHKNDMWGRGARSVALIDAAFDFDPAKPTPISPPSGPTQWLFQGPPAESKLLAADLRPHRFFPMIIRKAGILPSSLRPRVTLHLLRVSPCVSRKPWHL